LTGFLIGAVSGAAQFILLARFARAATRGGFSGKAALLGAAQFFTPLAVLLPVALLARRMLLAAGIGMASALIVCAASSYIASRVRRKGGNADV
jgi:hypothetical protein